jgi:hypothetical protein
MDRVRRIGTAVPVLLLAGAAWSACTAQQRAGDSPSYLIVHSLLAAPGGDPGQMSGTLASDVETRGGVLADGAEISFGLGLKDPGSSTHLAEPTTTNFITVNRYRVQFVRSDGRRTPGVDVPYPFDGAFTATVGDGGATITFTLVRPQSKLEAPLLALRGAGGAVAISTIAQVTFYGADQAGHAVSVAANIGVMFGDWTDPQ